MHCSSQQPKIHRTMDGFVSSCVPLILSYCCADSQASTISASSTGPKSLSSGNSSVELPDLPWSDWEIKASDIQMAQNAQGAPVKLGSGAYGTVAPCSPHQSFQVFNHVRDALHVCRGDVDVAMNMHSLYMPALTSSKQPLDFWKASIRHTENLWISHCS